MQLDREVQSSRRSEVAGDEEREARSLDEIGVDRQLEVRRERGEHAAHGEPAVRDGRDATPEAPAPFALMGYFTTPKDIVHACEALRDAGYSRFDAHTPFPVHGLEKAMGLKPSPMPWIVLGGGTAGLASGVLLAWYTQVVSYPLIISGKPPTAFQPYVPVLFELTILCAALACFFGLFTLTRLPTFFHPTMTHPAFPRATDDAFFVSVEAADPKFDAGETRGLLERLGARQIAEVAP
jgi:hypothetical protein